MESDDFVKGTVTKTICEPNRSSLNRGVVESDSNSFSFLFIRACSDFCKSLLSRFHKDCKSQRTMDKCILLLLVCMVTSSSCWSVPYYPARVPVRVVRYAVPPHHAHPPAPPHRLPVRAVREPVQESTAEKTQERQQRPKRGHDSYDYDGHGSSGVTGPVHTFVKTDKNANYKWGVRHHVGDKFSS